MQKLDVSKLVFPTKGHVDRDTPMSSASTRRSHSAKYFDASNEEMMDEGDDRSDEVMHRLHAMSTYFMERQQKICKKQVDDLLSLLMLKFSDSPASVRARQEIERVIQLGTAEAERLRLRAEDEVLRCSSEIAELRRTIANMIPASAFLAAQEQHNLLSQRNMALTERISELQSAAAADVKRASELQKENEGLQDRLRELSLQKTAREEQIAEIARQQADLACREAAAAARTAAVEAAAAAAAARAAAARRATDARAAQQRELVRALLDGLRDLGAAATAAEADVQVRPPRRPRRATPSAGLGLP
jgi:chromosome segregation ATPase